MPVYAFGHGQVKDPLFTCPVSAIPGWIWEVMDLWWTCRSLKALPRAGGVADQPYVVRRYFPLLEAEIAPIERGLDQSAHISGLATMMGAIFGGRTRGR